MAQLALEAAKALADKIHVINLGGKFSSWKGTSSGEVQLLKLRKSSAELVHYIGSNQSQYQIMAKYNELVNEINAAGLTGLVSESELTDYYNMVDVLWAAIEKQKDAK